MASFLDQAQAIWKALDEMSENDPDGYQKFIQEQLVEGAKMLGAAGSAGTTKTTISSQIGNLGGSSASAAQVSGSGRPAKVKNADAAQNSSTSKSKTIKTNESESVLASTPLLESNSLTDDSFKMSSLLTSIVNADAQNDEDSSLFALKELKLPGSRDKNGDGDSSKKHQRRTLIEEL